MNYYISNGTFYAVPRHSNELYHYGVPGMKWGKRKAQPVTVGGARGASKTADVDEVARQEARKAKVKKALKVGAAVAGTALAAYGAYKVSKFIKNKNIELATQKGEALAKQYINEHKNTLKSGSFAGHISNYIGGDFVGRTSRPVTNGELRSMARTSYNLNQINYNRAQGIKNRVILDAKNDTLRSAAKNVGSHYASKAKQSLSSSKVGKAVASAKAREAARKAAEAERERLRQEFIKRGTQAVLQRNTAYY